MSKAIKNSDVVVVNSGKDNNLAKYAPGEIQKDMAVKQSARMLVKETAEKSTRKIVVKGVEKAASKTAGKSAAKTVAKVIAKGTPGFIPVDLAQGLLEYKAEKDGNEDLKIVAKGAGISAYVGIGAAVGGPAGALTGAAVWAIGEIFSKLLP